MDSMCEQQIVSMGKLELQWADIILNIKIVVYYKNNF